MMAQEQVVSLILKFYELTVGEILIDNRNIEDYGLEDLRNEMAIVPQDVILFGGTIYENILYGNIDIIYVLI